MEAKEQILKAIQEAYNRPDLTEDDITTRDEVVFKAGRKEVVEWIEEQGWETFRTGYYPSQEMWQAQKKVWFNEKV